MFPFFPLEGNLDIDARDWGGGDHLGPHKSTQIQQILKTNISYENCSHIWDNFQKKKQNTL